MQIFSISLLFCISIIVQEFEKSNNYKCDCLYDLDIEISGVKPKKYQVRLIEPYSGSQDKINFALDLPKDKNSLFYSFLQRQRPPNY